MSGTTVVIEPIEYVLELTAPGPQGPGGGALLPGQILAYYGASAPGPEWTAPYLWVHPDGSVELVAP